MKSISVIGSTGSIGQKALEIVRIYPERFRVRALAARRNFRLLLKQAEEFKPEIVCLFDQSHAPKIAGPLKKLKIRLVTGEEGLVEAASASAARQVIFSLVGSLGLRPLFSAIRAGKDIAIANKEPLVMAGRLLMEAARERKIKLLPIDSEHSGLWQCLEGRSPASVKKLILTSSGGPFYRRKGSLARVSIREALRHPRWKMGPKITIDSATLMNKGLEVIEAANLFRLNVERVQVLIHPEAIVHALVEFVDGSHLAQLAITDMRIPIQYAMSFPERLNHIFPTLDLARVKTFHFGRPDFRRFPCLGFGYQAGLAGGTLPAVLNAANETAVASFLEGKIPFLGIPRIIERVLGRHQLKDRPSLDDIFQADQWAREEAVRLK